MANFKKENRINIYQDTIMIISDGSYTDGSGTRHEFNLKDLHENSRYFQKVKKTENTDEHRATVIYAQMIDCLTKAYEFGSDGALLNMASRYNPGGGVINGASAQEEDIFRRTTLGYSLYWYDDTLKSTYNYPDSFKGKSPYPVFGDRAGFWSPGVEIFRKADKGYYDTLTQPGITNIITVPGVRKPELTEDGNFKEAPARMWRNKIRTVLRLAIQYNKKKLVLGAWGCGAYCNPPKLMAALFKEVLDEPEFYGVFSEICFAILEDRNSPKGGNYAPFAEVFGHK